MCIIRAYALLRIISAHAHVRIICAHALFAILFGGRRKLPQAEEVRRPLGGARRVVLVGSGEGGECLICSTFYNVLGQGLGGDPDHLGGSGGHSPIMVRFRCFLSCVAVAAAFGWQGQ